ncbi:hypothetical protein [Mycobacterium sp. 236(2023)]|uniref:hypothetical protein n=1 Tax=Mycobacterium sp. 236(2023) TaxID=3038163 RepID=UPI00241584DE|nr:hypothetical protein [Mycobacterium sp. 236(2023)]MDG4669140.1 hypothetical protein [Mycobacterium sp. 236(2023)]
MDPSERIPHDDWVDQDLLTRDEAAARLIDEIAEVTRVIEAGNGDEVMHRRLSGMKEALKHYQQG